MTSFSSVLSHPWDLSPREAVALQKSLAGRIIETDDFGELRYVAGIDIGWKRGDEKAKAAAAVLTYPELELADWAAAEWEITFPYVPGLLSFREVPAALEALAKLKIRPDLLLCDGQGRAHPRRFGLACHIGLLTGLPAIGVAKSRLCGQFGNLPERKGSSAPLTDRGEIIGLVLRSRTGVKPLFVSVGHRIGLATAKEVVLRCVTRYRLPETTRWAHRIASEGVCPQNSSIFSKDSAHVR
ncbi:MAG: deoxyribonuclease V [Deltaproteobacteria bacterium]|nr:deoxyribonuclease V [Deltaproteobacteria bacterium]